MIRVVACCFFLACGFLACGSGAQAQGSAPHTGRATSTAAFRNDVVAACACAPRPAPDVAACISTATSSDEFRRWFEALAGMEPAQKLVHLGRALERAGVSECGLVAAWTPPPPSAPPPTIARDPEPETATDPQVTVEGDLDRNAIRTVIRDSLARFRHCYETELVKKPDLSGTVVAMFEIQGDGAVAKASASGMPEVHACIEQTLTALTFPKPATATPVTVRYPFVFRTAN